MLLYDTRGLLLPSPDRPFAFHVLNTSSSLVTGVHWNPNNAATFCVTFADGALAVYILGVASGNSIGQANCDTLEPAYSAFTPVVAVINTPSGLAQSFPVEPSPAQAAVAAQLSSQATSSLSNSREAVSGAATTAKIAAAIEVELKGLRDALADMQVQMNR